MASSTSAPRVLMRYDNGTGGRSVHLGWIESFLRKARPALSAASDRGLLLCHPAMVQSLDDADLFAETSSDVQHGERGLYAAEEDRDPVVSDETGTGADERSLLKSRANKRRRIDIERDADADAGASENELHVLRGGTSTAPRTADVDGTSQQDQDDVDWDCVQILYHRSKEELAAQICHLHFPLVLQNRSCTRYRAQDDHSAACGGGSSSSARTVSATTVSSSTALATGTAAEQHQEKPGRIRPRAEETSKNSTGTTRASTTIAPCAGIENEEETEADHDKSESVSNKRPGRGASGSPILAAAAGSGGNRDSAEDASILVPPSSLLRFSNPASARFSYEEHFWVALILSGPYLPPTHVLAMFLSQCHDRGIALGLPANVHLPDATANLFRNAGFQV